MGEGRECGKSDDVAESLTKSIYALFPVMVDPWPCSLIIIRIGRAGTVGFGC